MNHLSEFFNLFIDDLGAVAVAIIVQRPCVTVVLSGRRERADPGNPSHLQRARRLSRLLAVVQHPWRQSVWRQIQQLR